MKRLISALLVFSVSFAIAAPELSDINNMQGTQKAKRAQALKSGVDQMNLELEEDSLVIPELVRMMENRRMSQDIEASSGKGNGGDAIVCPTGVILLDSYEASKKQLTLDLSNPDILNPTWRSMVMVAVNRLSLYDKVTADLLEKYSLEMVEDFENFEIDPGYRGKFVYLGTDVLTPINDSLHISMPKDCEETPRQLVNQRKPRFKLDFRYQFNQTLWKYMTLQDQAMTILHEAWYRIMLESGAKDSVGARYMNGLIASKEFLSYQLKDYIEEVENTELNFYTIKNSSHAIKHSTLKFSTKKKEFETEDDLLCVKDLKMNLSIKKAYSLLDRTQPYYKGTVLPKVCFKDSTIRKIVLNPKFIKSQQVLRFPLTQLHFLTATETEPTIYFSAEGKVSHFSGIEFKKVEKMYYKCNGKRIYDRSDVCRNGPYIDHNLTIQAPSEIRFDLNEKVESHSTSQ